MVSPALYSSVKEDWETPDDLYEEYDKRFQFKVDLAASASNAKCAQYFNKEMNSLNCDWDCFDCWKWCNPPYGRKVGLWVAKAAASRGVVMLLPARTDTIWFHRYIYNIFETEIEFIKGRLKFKGAKDGAPFPSMIVIFR